MQRKDFIFNGSDKMPYELSAVIFTPDDGQIKSVLQVSHGMTEHFLRYESFAEKLTQNGIAVAGYDLRGHGRNKSLCGDGSAGFAEGGWECSVEDMRLFRHELLRLRPDARHYMLGFSLGSFLLREYLAAYPEDAPDGAIIMGTGCQPSFLLSIIMKTVSSQIKKFGFDRTTDKIKELSFGVYNKQFKPNRTESDWLCADKAQLDIYINDPLCRKSISAGLFLQLLESMRKTGKAQAFEAIPKQLPILLLSGKNDPVGGNGKGVAAVYNKLLDTGHTNVKSVLFDGARHDLLHEIDSSAAEKATDLITDFLK